MTLRVRAPDVRWDTVFLVEGHVHALAHANQHTVSPATRGCIPGRVSHLRRQTPSGG